MVMIPLFSDHPVSRADFEAMPPHMRTEFALLVAERRVSAATAGEMGIPESILRAARRGCTPHALTYSEIRVLDDDAPVQPHQKQRKDAR